MRQVHGISGDVFWYSVRWNTPNIPYPPALKLFELIQERYLILYVIYAH